MTWREREEAVVRVEPAREVGVEMGRVREMAVSRLAGRVEDSSAEDVRRHEADPSAGSAGPDC